MVTRKRMVEGIAYAMILFFFVGASFLLVTLGARIYQRIETRVQIQFNQRTPLAYLRMKVRQFDHTEGIKIVHKEGQAILVLCEKYEGDSYETWIYTHEGSLKEYFMQEGDPFEWHYGEKVMPLLRLEADLQGALLKLQIETMDGKIYQEYSALQCHESEEPNE